MSLFRRRLLIQNALRRQGGGGGEDLPQWFKESIVGWYDIEKQNTTNEEMALNPILRDFSGNKYDLILQDFQWNEKSGILGNSLHFDGTCFGYNNHFLKLDDYTIIVNRENLGRRGTTLGKKEPSRSAFLFEVFDTINANYNESWSKGRANDIDYYKIKKKGISWQTKNSYNGFRIDNGGQKDTEYLYLGTIRENEPKKRFFTGYIKEVFVFSKSLDENKIQWVIDNLTKAIKY